MMIASKFTTDIGDLKETFWPFIVIDNDVLTECSLNDEATDEAIEAFETYKKQMKIQNKYESKARFQGFM